MVDFLSKLNPRLAFAIIFLASSGALGFAFFAQFFEHADPCPLCIAQRAIYAVIALFSLFGIINGTSKLVASIYSTLILATSIFGIKTAYHHVWLQGLPPAEWPASCGMPLDILYKQIPLSGFLHTILSGSAECAMVSWKVLGISGAKMSMYGFIGIGLLVLINAINLFTNNKRNSSY